MPTNFTIDLLSPFDISASFLVPTLYMNVSLTTPLLKAIGPGEEELAACEFLYKIHPEMYKEERLTFEVSETETAKYRLLLRAIDDSMCEFRNLIANLLTFLDPTECPYPILPLLAPIVGIDFNFDVPEDMGRAEIVNAIFLWERKGTRDNFRDWIQFITGYRVHLREFYKEVLRTNVWGQAYHNALPAPSDPLVWREEWESFLPVPSYEILSPIPPLIWEEEWERNVPGDPYATLPHLDEHHRTNSWDGTSLIRPFHNFHFDPDLSYGVHGFLQAKKSDPDNGEIFPGYLFRNHVGIYIDFPESDLVDTIDTEHTSKPTNSATLINSFTIEDGLRVIFTGLTGAQLYDNFIVWKADVSGPAVTWTVHTSTSDEIGIEFYWYDTAFLEIILQKIARIVDLITLFGVINHLFWRLISYENGFLCREYEYDVVPRFIEGWGENAGDDVELPPAVDHVTETLNCDLDESLVECFGDTYNIDIGNVVCCVDTDQCEGRLATFVLCTNDEERLTNSPPIVPTWLTFYPAKYWTHQVDDILEEWTPTVSGGILTNTTTIPAEYDYAEVFINPLIGTGTGQGVELPTTISSFIEETCLNAQFEDLVHFEEWDNSFITSFEFTDDWEITQTFTESFEFTDNWNFTETFASILEFSDDWEITEVFDESFEFFDDWEDNLPMLIPDNEVWLDGNNGPMGNSPIHTWLDRSGSLNTAVQSIVTSRPDHLVPDALYNNFGSVTFDGINDYMEIPNNALLNTDSFSIYLVGEWTNPSNFDTFVSKVVDETMTTGGWGLVKAGAANTLRFFVDNINTHYIDYVLPNNTPVIIKATYNQTTLSLSINGVLVVSGLPLYGGGTVNSSTALHIGAHRNTTIPPVSGFLPGTIAEFIYYSRILTGPESLSLLLYLSEKYNIALTLESIVFSEDWELSSSYTPTTQLTEPFNFDVAYSSVTEVSETFNVTLTYSETELVDEGWNIAGVSILHVYEPWTAPYLYTGSGGMITGGTAAKAITKVYTTSGGLVSGGAATTTTANTFTYTASGGMVTSGTAGIVTTKAYTASGGAITGGTAAIVTTQDYVGSGGMTTGGAGTTSYTAGGGTVFTYTGTGGMTTGGTASVAITQDYIGSGGMTTGGAGTTSYVAAGAGGVTENWEFATTYSSTSEVVEPFNPTTTSYSSTSQVTEPFNPTSTSYSEVTEVTEPWNVTLSYSETILVNNEGWNS